ncbi:MAG TPA: SRPBCC domain-containing protein [Terriglobales bacterium]
MKSKFTELATDPTRRQVMIGAAVAIGSLATGSKALGQSQSMEELPSTGADATRTSLHQEVDFKSGAMRIYAALLDSKQFSTFTGMPATIDGSEGGALSMFGGRITGRNIELVANQRIVQAWRPENWDPGVYSLVKFELKENGPQTKIILDHTGFPETNYGHLYSGWYARYWEPLKKYLA